MTKPSADDVRNAVLAAEKERIDGPIDLFSAVKIKKLHPDAKLPEYATEHAAGADLSSVEDLIVAPGARQPVSTGLSMEIPVGYELQIRPRSGLALKNGITVMNTPGTIDADYRGEIKVILYNSTATPFQVTKGNRIAQGVFARVHRGDFEVVDELSDTARGTGGFGHTGQ